MASWKEIAMDNFEAAKRLGDVGHHRSCVNRAYFAAFSAASHALRSHAPFGKARETPAHSVLPQLVKAHFAKQGESWVRRTMAAIRRLYNARITADYRSGHAVNQGVAMQARRDAHLVCSALGAFDATGN